MYASLCLMTRDTTVMGSRSSASFNSSASSQSLQDTCVNKLRKLFKETLLSNYQQHAHPLVYDSIYGGIISSEAFHTGDAWSDFGNGMYNDHHYHYGSYEMYQMYLMTPFLNTLRYLGYWITAAAILKHLDPSWYVSNVWWITDNHLFI